MGDVGGECLEVGPRRHRVELTSLGPPTSKTSGSLELHWEAQSVCMCLIQGWSTRSPPPTSDLQSIWLLLSFCTAPRRFHAAMCGDSLGRGHHQPHVGRRQFTVEHGWFGHQA